MNIKDFFRFSSKLSSSTFQAHAVGLNLPLSGLSDYDRLITGDYNDISFPVVFKQASGKNLQDVLETGWPNLYLISENMKTLLEQSGLTGWKTFSIKVFDKKENEIHQYYGFSILGHCGPIDYKKCEIIEKQLIPNGSFGKYYKGLPVGLDKWDGSDFFLPEGTFRIIATKKAADALKKKKITNIALKNLSEIETPDFSIKNM